MNGKGYYLEVGKEAGYKAITFLRIVQYNKNLSLTKEPLPLGA